VQEKITDWERLLRAAAELQQIIPKAVLVGGTAAAIHAEHRFSLDANHVLPDLEDNFQALLDFLESNQNWRTQRVQPPKLILGRFMGIETGLRQLIRKKPLETVEIILEQKKKDMYREEEVSPLLQLARQLAEPVPYDLEDINIEKYKGIIQPWDTWKNIKKQCEALSCWIATLIAENK